MHQEQQWGNQQRGNQQRSTGLVEVLDRVLDKGLVIAGDIKISLVDIELLTIRIRLIVCSLEKAEQVGLDWWKYDRNLSPRREPLMAENEALRRQLHVLERKVARLAEQIGDEGAVVPTKRPPASPAPVPVPVEERSRRR